MGQKRTLPINRDQAAKGHPEPESRYETTIGGTIFLVEPRTCSCQVIGDDGNEYRCLPFPGLVQDSEGSGGEISVPRTGQRVELKVGGALGPRIRGYLPSAMDALKSSESTPSLFGPAEQASPVASGKVDYRGSLPSGLLAGDWCRVGNLGQHVSVLEGGAAVLCGSPWAKVAALGGVGTDTVKIDARRLSIMTGFGHLDFSDENGRQSFHMQGGLDQPTETGYNRHNFTIIGGFGDPVGGTPIEGVPSGLGYLKFKTKTGETLFQNVIGNTGSFKNETAGPVEFYHRDSFSHTIFAGEEIKVLQRDSTLTVANGNRAEDIALNCSLTVGANRYVNVFGGDSEVIMGNKYLSAQAMQVQLTGIPTSIPGASTYKLSMANGSFDIEIGKPPTDLNAALSSFNLNVYPAGGHIKMSCLAGNIEASATTGLIKLSSALPATLKSNTMVNIEAVKINLGGVGATQPLLLGGAVAGAMAAFCTAVGAACAGDTSPAKGTFASIAAAASALSSAFGSCLSTKSFTV